MKTKNIKHIHLVNWPVPKVLAFTTTKHCPGQNTQQLAKSPYGQFNLGLHVGDNEKSVLNNRTILTNLLPNKVAIQWLEQVHGNHVAEITELSAIPKADAAYTQNPNIALAIMTADCLPILIANQAGNEIAAIHGGWRPLAQNIIALTLKKFNSKANELHVWLGPCIGKDNFEVGSEVKAAFVALDNNFAQAFRPSNNASKYLADLQLIARLQLMSLGVKHIYQLPDCTVENAEQYYSYRREKQTGRMASIICQQK